MSLRHPPALLVDLTVVAVALFDVAVHVHYDEPVRLAWALTASLALLLRRRLPLLTFLLTLPAVLVSDAVFAALAALYTLASLSRRRWLLAGCVLAFTVADMAPWSAPKFDLSEPSSSRIRP
ncbi:DUF7134 domain-containing protein [Actinacidiphila glaucinigra]|uniref:DUF7134 domain-containing protein n=1 Tax=Actinacidiphila glaucinigra TaxID=235986 RepID=UPI003D9401D4